MSLVSDWLLRHHEQKAYHSPTRSYLNESLKAKLQEGPSQTESGDGESSASESA